MQYSTVVYITRNNRKEVLLGKRKSKTYATDKWNGFGGKQEEGETLEETAVRELYEESGIKMPISELEKVAELKYEEPDKDWFVCVYLINDYDGVNPVETEEMIPKWFNIEKLPFDEMWENDRLWLPRVLNGEKLEGVIKNDLNGKVLYQDLSLLTN